MPYRQEWFDPEVFVEHRGVRIYHVYREDSDAILSYWYTTSDETDDTLEFDARDLPGYSAAAELSDDIERCRTAIIAAIEAGLITQDGLQEEPR